jgi:hypothetical protein
VIKIIPILKRLLVSEYFSAIFQCKETRPSPWQQTKEFLTMLLSDATSETKYTGKESQDRVQNCRDDAS